MQANLSSVRARRASIARQIEDLQTEDAELASVEGVLQRLSGGGRAAPARAVATRGRKPGRPAARGAKKTKGKPVKRGRGRGADAGSQRELVLQALKKPGAGWMNVRDIIATVKSAHGVDIPPRSLSPLLSNMKNAGVIVRNGRKVAAPGQGRGR